MDLVVNLEYSVFLTNKWLILKDWAIKRATTLINGQGGFLFDGPLVRIYFYILIGVLRSHWKLYLWYSRLHWHFRWLSHGLCFRTAHSCFHRRRCYITEHTMNFESVTYTYDENLCDTWLWVLCPDYHCKCLPHFVARSLLDCIHQSRWPCCGIESCSPSVHSSITRFTSDPKF